MMRGSRGGGWYGATTGAVRVWVGLALALAWALGVQGAATDRVVVFDARPLRRLDLEKPDQARRLWDTLHVLACLQGLANRERPRLYLLHCAEFGVETDVFWWDWYRNDDGWLREVRVETVTELTGLLETLRGTFEGLVVYDGEVPATSNLASTAAGVERLLPVRWDPAPDSVYTRLRSLPGVEVKLWLVRPDGSPKFDGRGKIPESEEASSGSAKVDAYRWGMRRWLRAGACGKGVGAYYVDAYWLKRPTWAGHEMHTLANHDWFVARRAFFFDLSPWGDEAPVDDPGQPVGSDKRCLLEILRELAAGVEGGIVKLGGFPPWPLKYTTHGGAGRHEPVPTEWEFTRLISQFNTYKEADAAGLGAIANASFHAFYPLRARYPQPNPKPTLADWRARGWVDANGRVAPKFFVGHYVGDYDAPSWLYKAVPAFFRDPARGRVPLGWAFDPNLADRAPQALVYAYAHATTNDYFIAGDSGAGYLNPRGLSHRPDSGLGSGLEAWTVYCRERYERWGMSITGFLLDGSAGASTEREFAAYGGFSPDGLGTHFERGWGLRAGVPTCPERDLPDDARAAVGAIAERARKAGGQAGFLWARSILKSPSWYAEVSRRLREEHGDLPIEVVDPYSFFGLIRQEARGGAASD